MLLEVFLQILLRPPQGQQGRDARQQLCGSGAAGDEVRRAVIAGALDRGIVIAGNHQHRHTRQTLQA